MSSESRSSSAVRNLRSIFENKASESTTPGSRGRSPSGIGSDKENNYQPPKTKVRASFVSVEPAPNMAAAVEGAGVRRGSFGEADGDLELRKTISDQQHELDVPEGAIESMPPSAVATPLRPPNEGRLGYDDVPSVVQADKPPDNPDKPVTGAEEDPIEMKPADPANEDAVSGGEALPPVAEDLRSPTKTTASASKVSKKPDAKETPKSVKPPTISTKAATKPPPSSIKSPASQPKTPLSGKASSSNESPIATRPSRSSLTAPTAASMARSGPLPEKSKTSPTSRAKPREVTKPLTLSSHLTAPTASSKAKHDPETTAPSLSSRVSLSSRPKPQIASIKPTSRSSLAAGQRPQSRDSETSARRSLATVDGSFLDRMTRPTAASSSRTIEKVAAKSPPTSKPSSKPKVNGHVSKPSTKSKTDTIPVAEPTETAQEGQASLTFAANADNLNDAIAAVNDGNETPIHQNSIGNGDAALEATPAALGTDEMIR